MEEFQRLSNLLSQQLTAAEDTVKRLTEAVKALIEQSESRKRPRTCQGCEEDQPNQMAHYGGCIVDPIERLYPNE
jgi:hypothetical protein